MEHLHPIMHYWVALAERTFLRLMMIALGFALAIVGLAMGVSIVMMPIGLVVGLSGIGIIIGGALADLPLDR
jgi:hypothetical protein